MPATDLSKASAPHRYEHCVTKLGEGSPLSFYDFNKVATNDEVERLPACIRVFLENCIRNCDDKTVHEADVKAVLKWGKEANDINYKPARVLLQDFTGVPAVVDLATMRDAMMDMGGDPAKINPLVPTELVIDHSIVVDSAKDAKSLKINEDLEMERNKERFAFLKWGSMSFENMTIVPPGNGICHQVNLEYLGRAAFQTESLVYPDTCVGTDSHTTMISGLGVIGWGVGGIEAEAVMLGQPYSMSLPEVVGFELTGKIDPLCTATDIVLTVTSMLRKMGVVGKIVEFVGEGALELSVADRATIANMAPEYGATTGFFPPDNKTLEYLENTGRDATAVNNTRTYFQKSGFIGFDYKKVDYSATMTLDLSTVIPSVAGPKRPQDLVHCKDLKTHFTEGLTRPVDFSSFGLESSVTDKRVTVKLASGNEVEIGHGTCVLAAITSCTNTSNPSVMIGAGLVARKAIAAGLKVPEFVKTSLSPGSLIVKRYLEESGLITDLESMGFYTAGYGCMTCIGNSGEIDPALGEAIANHDLVVSAVLSGNRNFEGRVHPQTRANYLASPMLVVAYALSGKVDIDFESEPLCHKADGTPVFLKEIWPTREEIDSTMSCINKGLYQEVYKNVRDGSDAWRALEAEGSPTYKWDSSSTYVAKPPFFEGMTADIPGYRPIKDARVLGYFGDSITTDHISPAGKITASSPAGKYLIERGTKVADFNSYGSRRGNDAVMNRGTFANIRLVNKLASKVGPFTKVNLENAADEDVYFFEAAEQYKAADVSTVIIAGNLYGTGSSRDWAAKGTLLQGVRAVIAQSFERIHRSNLVGMGVLPCEFKPEDSPESLGLTGKEQFSFHIDDASLKNRMMIKVSTDTGKQFEVKCRLDTAMELEYYRNGGILNYMIRQLA